MSIRCGSVSSAVVASNTRGPQFESSHQEIILLWAFLLLTIEKTKINKKRPGMARLLELI